LSFRHVHRYHLHGLRFDKRVPNSPKFWTSPWEYYCAPAANMNGAVLKRVATWQRAEQHLRSAIQGGQTGRSSTMLFTSSNISRSIQISGRRYSVNWSVGKFTCFRFDV